MASAFIRVDFALFSGVISDKGFCWGALAADDWEEDDMSELDRVLSASLMEVSDIARRYLQKSRKSVFGNTRESMVLAGAYPQFGT